jgi:hypothetical protein
MKELVREQITKMPKGAVFMLSEFGSITNIKMAITRLENEGLIRRVLRGVYEYPEYSEFLGEYVATNPNKVAEALARNYGWTIVPSGDVALNILGLSTQVVSVWVYLSDGPYKKYEFDGKVIEFKHKANREITVLSHKTALVVQALKTLGQSNVTVAIINKLSNDLTSQEKQAMLNESKLITDWAYEVIKKICGVK